MSNRGAGPSTVEYSLCIDTVNRDVKQFPDTNDLVLELDASRLRRGTVQMYIGSIELPVPQFTIEEAWKNLCFDEGIRITGTSAGRSIQIVDGPNTYIGTIPMYRNPVASLTVVDPTTIAVVTAFPHALATLADLWGAVLPITLVGVSVADPQQLILNGSNPGFAITGPSAFTLTVTSTAAIANAAFPLAGVVSAPNLDNPDSLCAIINAALQLDGFSGGVFAYDRLLSQYQLRCNSYRRPPPSNCGIGNQLATASNGNPNIVILALPQDDANDINLSTSMGFANRATTTTTNTVGQWCVFTDNPAAWRASISMNVGFYSPGDLSSLGGDISMQFNRFLLENPDLLLFSNALGTSISVPVPAGKYYPDSLAAFLQQQMNALDPQSLQNNPAIPSANAYLVSWNASANQQGGCGSITGSFVFGSSGVFGLEFGDSASLGSSLPMRMGFNNLAYRNGPQYSSSKEVIFPVLGTGAAYFHSKVFQIVANSGRRGYRIDPSMGRVVAGTVTSLTPLVSIGFTSAVAHGFQETDILNLNFPGATPIFGVQATVLAVTSAFAFTVAWVNGLVPATALGNGFSASIVGESTSINIYFNSNLIPNTRKQYSTIYPIILGFDYNDLLAPAPFISITTASLDPPTYLLLQVLDVKGSSYTQHNYQGENLTNIFAKVIFFPAVQVQRMYPMSQTFNGSEILTQLHFRWLTPDHSLYQFHGRNWSATIEFQVMSEVPVLLCG